MPATSLPSAHDALTADIRLVRDVLASLRCPRFGDSPWIAVFEQLASAGYALLAAEKHGYSHRDQRRFAYHGRIRADVVGWLAGYAFPQYVSDYTAQDDLLSGFYFNSAVERLVWAAERMVATFAAVPCPCGRAPEPRGAAFSDCWKSASQRLEHVSQEDRIDLLNFGLVMLQLAPERHQREPELNPEMVLPALRFEVAHRRSPARLNGRSPADDRPAWSTAGPLAQANLAGQAFALLCRAFNELVDWQPNARQEALPALGEWA